MLQKFPHQIRYIDCNLTLDEAIDNLRAQKRLIEQGVNVLTRTVPGMDVTDVTIRVVQVSAGSFTTEFVVQLYSSYQDNIEDAVTKGVEGLFGVDIPEDMEPLVTLAALAVTYFVARFAYDAIRSRKKDRSASTHIEGDYNTVLNIMADKLNISQSAIEDALQDTVTPPKRRSLIGSVTRFFRPEHSGKNGPINVKGFGDIKRETIGEYPTDAELSEIDETRNIDIPEATIDIRATDRDRFKKGWAAVLVGHSEFKKRMPMDIYPTVDVENLSHYDTIVGDVIVEGETSPQGKFRPKIIHLIKFDLEKSKELND